VVDGSEHYPRTDAAVIMLVLDADDRLLLGRQTTWPEGRFSTLAGFVEPGVARGRGPP
jgi:NAD+ diphosphatase